MKVAVGGKTCGTKILKDSRWVHDNSIFMQIHFRGLGGFGRGGSDSFIQSGIRATSIHSE